MNEKPLKKLTVLDHFTAIHLKNNYLKTLFPELHM